MDVAAFLEEVCALPGHSGMEAPVAARFAEPLGMAELAADETRVKGVIATCKKSTGSGAGR